MNWLNQVSARIGALFGKRNLDAEMAEEMQFHLEVRTERNIANGMSPEEAREAAQRSFGGIEQTKELCRDEAGGRWLHDAVADLKFAARQLRKSPGFTAVAVVSLALGVGANTAIFSIVNELLLKPLSVRDPQDLVVFRWHGRPSPDADRFLVTGDVGFSPAIFQRFLAQSPAGLDLFALAPLSRLSAVVDGRSEVVPTSEAVSGNYFAVLGVQALMGRTLAPADDRPDAVPATVISHRCWLTRFAGDPDVVGKSVWLNKIAFTIAGVAPPDFPGTMPVAGTTDFFVPLHCTPRLRPAADGRFELNGNWHWWVRIMGRLQANDTAEDTRVRLEPIFQAAALEGARQPMAPGDPNMPRLSADSGARGPNDSRTYYWPVLAILAAIVGSVLLIACINLATLLLSRAAARRKEMSVRLAMGAGRGRLVRQLLTESLLLSLLGGVAGGFLAWWSQGVVTGLIPTDTGLGTLNVSIDWRVLAFTGAIAVLAGFFFGLIPAVHATRVDVSAGLGGGTRNRADRGRAKLSKILIVAQVAMSFVLLVGAGFFVRSLQNLERLDPGFNHRNLLLFEVDAEASGHSRAESTALYRRMTDSIGSLPGVEDVTFSQLPILSGDDTRSGINVPGYQPPGGGEYEMVHANAVGPGFFETFQLPILHGRGLEPRDEPAGQNRKVVVVSESLARMIFGEDDVVGRRTSFGEIVGVVRDARDGSLRKIEPNAYVPFHHYPFDHAFATGRSHFAVRTSGDSATAVASIRQAVRELDAALPLFNVRTQMEQIGRLTQSERLFAQLSGFFGLLAAGLVCVGLYGLMSYSVVQRTNEIGVRIALGAQRGAVLGMVLRESLSLVAMGLTAGIAGAFFVVKLVSSRLYALSPGDPTTYGGVALLLCLLAVAACLLPALRAAQVDPLTALRCE